MPNARGPYDFGTGDPCFRLQCEALSISTGKRCELEPAYSRRGRQVCPTHATAKKVTFDPGIIAPDEELDIAAFGECRGNDLEDDEEREHGGHHIVSGTLCRRCLQYVD